MGKTIVRHPEAAKPLKPCLPAGRDLEILRFAQDDEIRDKLHHLTTLFRSYQRVLVAFSGGTDSAFVLKIAREVLGKENVLAVIAKSPSLPARELEEAREIAREIDAELRVIKTRELENSNYAANPVNRCYFCKSELYSRLEPLAKELGFRFILNGTNVDDLGDWRPGLKAAEEHAVKSPLVEAEFTKEDIRSASKQMGLSTWSKPQAACLSSRLPFGVSVTTDKLRQVERGEALLKELGFRVVRLRWLDGTALIEVGADETQIFFKNPEVRRNAVARLHDLGFQTIDLNLKGYRSGRFNPNSVGADLRVGPFRSPGGHTGPPLH